MSCFGEVASVYRVREAHRKRQLPSAWKDEMRATQSVDLPDGAYVMQTVQEEGWRKARLDGPELQATCFHAGSNRAILCFPPLAVLAPRHARLLVVNASPAPSYSEYWHIKPSLTTLGRLTHMSINKVSLVSVLSEQSTSGIQRSKIQFLRVKSVCTWSNPHVTKCA